MYSNMDIFIRREGLTNLFEISNSQLIIGTDSSSTIPTAKIVLKVKDNTGKKPIGDSIALKLQLCLVVLNGE